MNTLQTLSQHYGQMLSLKEPWFIEDVDLNTETLRLGISVSAKKGAKLPCPECGKLCPREDHRQTRSWRHLDTMQFETTITCSIPRIRCKDHGILSAKVPWADKYSRFTLLFERFAIDVLLSAKSAKSAMKVLRLSWDQAHDIRKRAVQRGLGRREDEPVRHIGIDEKNFLKGHSYVSLLTDIQKGRVLDVTQGRTEETTLPLFEALSDQQKASVEAAAMDMWPAYMNAVESILPEAEIVHDKYHVATYLGKAVDSVRKQENRILAKSGNDSLKGTKYLWLTNPDNLTRKAKKTFRELVIDEMRVGKAWAIKESFRHFWMYHYLGAAEKFFKRWYFWATHSRLKPVIKAAKTLKRHFKGILAYLRHHITNAVTEGINSQIQSIKANARGFRNFENYRIAILFYCGKLEMYP